MVSVGSRDMSTPRGDARERQRTLDKRSVNRFESMLDQALAMSHPVPATSERWQAAASEGNDETSRASVASRSPLADTASPTLANMPAGGTQNLALRVSTGPLAGLIVQASWRDHRLQLRVQAPSEALRRRLAQHGAALENALADALGVTVTLELEAAHV